MKKTNYAGNDMVMRCLNRSVATINITFQLLDIYRFFPFIFLYFFWHFLFLLSYYKFVTLILFLFFPHKKLKVNQSNENREPMIKNVFQCD